MQGMLGRPTNPGCHKHCSSIARMTQAACVVTHLAAEERQFPLIVEVFLGKPDLVLSR